MNFRNLALDHASKGYYVFPVNKEKIPYRGLLDWENVATIDHSQVHEWWDEHPGALPALAPGRTNMAVIDLDRHPDKPSGFETIKSLKIKVGNPFHGKSISGNGLHLWYRGHIGSANGIFPGIDRKASGGYVVAPYRMIALEDHVIEIPEVFTGGGGAGSSQERQSMSDKELDLWMLTVGDGPLSARMQSVVGRFSASGNEQMSRNLAAVAALASAGHTGAFHAINKMADIWSGGKHSSGDPEREFHASLRSAIERFGRVPDEDSKLYERWLALTTENITYLRNADNLKQALSVFMERVCPKSPDLETIRKVNSAWRNSMKALDLVTTTQRENLWMELSQKNILKAIGA